MKYATTRKNIDERLHMEKRGRPSLATDKIRVRKQLSKMFTIELIENWLRDYGESPVTSEDLLNNGNCGYTFLRAAGVSNPSYGRSAVEIRRMKVWFDHYSQNPLPTRDGRDDAILEAAGERDGLPAWIIRARPRAYTKPMSLAYPPDARPLTVAE